MGLFTDILKAIAATDSKTGRKTSDSQKVDMYKSYSPRTQRGTPRTNRGTNRLVKMDGKSK